MAISITSDTRTSAQRGYDKERDRLTRALERVFELFPRLEDSETALEREGDSRVAEHAKMKTAIQSLSDHLKNTTAVTDGVAQSVIDQATIVSGL